MRVLVACEESQRVCIAFRERGHEAYSCDIQDCSGGHPEWHIKDNVLNILNPQWSSDEDFKMPFYGIWFFTVDGVLHCIDRWDLIIAHPPCTRLCNSGQRWLYFGDEIYRKRKLQDQKRAIAFFMEFVTADCEKIAIENPMGIMSSKFRKPDQVYNPYDFLGETESKKTCLWLKGLAPLKATQELSKDLRTQGIWKAEFDGNKYAWNDPIVAVLRSRTPWGVAHAMAEQWG